MRRLVDRLRFRWFLATHSLDYTADYLRLIYRIYLNHGKIVHYRDGYPVCSLSTPALFSKPAANFAARAMYRTIQNRNLPNLMSFAVNDICNAACVHCSFYTSVDEPGRAVLSLTQACDVIRQAQALGVSVINFVGGEPLLRPDLLDLLRAVDKDLSTTVVFTNGALLAQRARELRRAGLDGVYVSIDAADAEAHDRFRGAKGLFEEAVAGIAAAKSAGLSTGMSCTITPEAFRAGELARLLELGKRLGVHEVIAFDAMPSGRYKARDDLVDDAAWVDAMIDSVAPYNADPSYPGILVWAYTAGYRAVGCACGTSYFYVSPYGDVMSCDFNHVKLGNVLETPLWRIWDAMSGMDEFRQAKWGGCKIKDSEYRARPTVSG